MLVDVFGNISGEKKFFLSKLVTLFSGVLKICRNPESIQYSYRKHLANVFLTEICLGIFLILENLKQVKTLKHKVHRYFDASAS